LGDSSYGDSFCAAGKKIFSLLTELKGDAIAEILEIDACETLEPEIEVVSWVKSIMAKFP
ncbi:MAG: flavodoxin, partial [Paraglaciecola sp.]